MRYFNIIPINRGLLQGRKKKKRNDWKIRQNWLAYK